MRSSNVVVSYSPHSCSLCLPQSSEGMAAARAEGVDDFHCKGGSDMEKSRMSLSQGRVGYCYQRTRKCAPGTSVTFDLRMSACLETEMRQVPEIWAYLNNNRKIMHPVCGHLACRQKVRVSETATQRALGFYKAF